LTKEIAIVIDSKDQLAGLTESDITSAAYDAKAAGHDGKYLMNITNTTRQPVLVSLENRELCQHIWEASANRGLSGENETASLVSCLVQLRAECAPFLAYKNFRGQEPTTESLLNRHGLK